jgi:hypothetical protein
VHRKREGRRESKKIQLNSFLLSFWGGPYVRRHYLVHIWIIRSPIPFPRPESPVAPLKALRPQWPGRLAAVYGRPHAWVGISGGNQEDGAREQHEISQRCVYSPCDLNVSEERPGIARESLLNCRSAARDSRVQNIDYLSRPVWSENTRLGAVASKKNGRLKAYGENGNFLNLNKREKEKTRTRANNLSISYSLRYSIVFVRWHSAALWI